jgi:hypothetical protein
MKNVKTILLVSATLTMAGFIGCSGTVSSTATGTTGGSTTATTTSSMATTTGTTGAGGTTTTGTSVTTGGGGAGGMGGAGGGNGSGGFASRYECTLPATPPSNGSCVAFVPGDAGELDAGIDDAGHASVTNCNPITNAGCTGTDVCGPDVHDPGDMNYFCQPAGNPGAVAACGDCTSVTATCGAGGLCVGVNLCSTEFFCARMCCTDADCGAGRCDTTDYQLPSNVGLCVTT